MASVNDIFKYKFIECDIRKLLEYAKANDSRNDGETHADVNEEEKK